MLPSIGFHHQDAFPCLKFGRTRVLTRNLNCARYLKYYTLGAKVRAVPTLSQQVYRCCAAPAQATVR